jgi:hypothetical protein
MALMVSITDKLDMLSVVMLSVVMLDVMAPLFLVPIVLSQDYLPTPRVDPVEIFCSSKELTLLLG